MTDTGVRATRATRQRSALTSLMDSIGEFRSAQELHDELRRRGDNIGLTTVYRTLQSMSAANLVDTLRTDTGESVYRRCSSHHHHHLVCRGCGATVEVAGPEVETWASEVAAAQGFSDVSHTIEIFGTCADCVTGAKVQSASAFRTSAPVSSTISTSVRSASSVSPAAGKL
jgi:Fur family ferric uptake transcriptional regulator